MMVIINARQSYFFNTIIYVSSPLSSMQIFSGFLSLWMMPTLWSYFFKSATENFITTETGAKGHINTDLLHSPQLLLAAGKIYKNPSPPSLHQALKGKVKRKTKQTQNNNKKKKTYAQFAGPSVLKHIYFFIPQWF